jgi:signal transduction histidine kinase/ligand-binding sensor domain-containing protein
MTTYRTKSFLLLIGFYLCCSPLYAQHWKVAQYNEENGLPNDYLYTLSYDKDKILLGSDAGLVTFDSRSFEIDRDFKNMYPTHLHRMSDSVLIISTYRNGIFRKTENSLVQISDVKGDFSILSHDTNLVFLTTYSDRDERILLNAHPSVSELFSDYPKEYRFVAGKEGLYCFRKNVLQLAEWNGKLNDVILFDDHVTTLMPLEKKLLVGHAKGKIQLWIPNGEIRTFQLDTGFDIQKIYRYGDRSFIVVNSKDEYDQLYYVRFNRNFTEIVESTKILDRKAEINDVLVRNGNVFCATYGEGLYILSPTPFLSIDTYSKGMPRMQNLTQDKDGRVWGNTVQSLYQVDLKRGLSKIAFTSKLEGILQTKNTTYISLAASGLCDLDLNVIVRSHHPLKELFNSNDSIFLGYGKYDLLQVNIREGTEKRLFRLKNTSSGYGKFNTGALIDQYILLGTDRGVIELRKGERDSWERVQNNRRLSFFDDKKISQILYEKGILYVLAEGDLFSVSNGVIEEMKFSNKPNVKVNQIMFDSRSNLFLATNKGFWMIRKDKSSLHYNASNGLLSEKVYNFMEDSDSNIWIVTGKSLEVINYKDLKASPAPKLFFQEKVQRTDGVTLTFSSYQYDFPDDITFEYKLNDGEWIPLESRTLDLRNLAPDSYTCFIRAKRSNSAWSKSIDYGFEVKAEWYQTNEFKLFLFLILLISSYIIFRIRLKKVRAKNAILENEITERKRLEKKVQNLREEISQDFHDELGNKIASISGISNSLIHSTEEKNVPKMKEISKLSSEMYDSTKDFVWLLNPDNNNIQSLCLYLRDYCENYFDLIGNVDFFFYQKDIRQVPISYEWMKNIVLTVKEIMTNVVRHSEATQVTMKVELEADIFQIEIFDNGKGIEEDKILHGNGLDNILSRMRKLKAEINSDYTQGVRYLFKLKIKSV